MHERHCLLAMYVILIFTVKAMQKELGIGQDFDESDSWSQMKWDSIFKLPNSKEFSENVDARDSLQIDTLNKGIKPNLELSESEAHHFSEDEVFINDLKDSHKNPSEKDVPEKPINADDSFHLNTVSDKSVELPENPQINEMLNSGKSNENFELNLQSESSESSWILDSSQVANKQEPLVPKSFIFNPNAQPQEHFQNCTTPQNETGSCRYLQHCLFPSIVSSFNQFMEYVCIIEERFIGVCCPEFPVSVVTIQDEKDQIKSESNHGKECGVGTNKRIVGGSNADPKAWPWMVALLTKSRKFFCGGVLINDRHVLTAAHCTFGIPNNKIIARLGEYNFKDDGEDHVEFPIAEIKRHGNYNRRTLINDIALLKLESPVNLNETIETICFPEGEKSYVGEKATLVGWGNLAGGSPTSDILQQASFPVISNEDCSKGHGLSIAPSLICTASEAGDKGACNGDSGGPLMLLDENNRWKVIGLVSWGRRGCSPEFPTVYTRVSHYLDWIKKHSG